MLRDSEAINRRDLIRNIFKENTEELDEYVAAEIICYRNIRKEYIKPATTDQDNTKETTTEKIAIITVALILVRLMSLRATKPCKNLWTNQSTFRY
jgi:hypothetical protein